jgi:hypothetical protein
LLHKGGKRLQVEEGSCCRREGSFFVLEDDRVMYIEEQIERFLRRRTFGEEES